MRPLSGAHEPDHSELLFLHALQALPSSDVSIVEGLLATCDSCRQEMETLRPLADAVMSAYTDLMRPSPSVWERLAARIAAEAPGDNGVLRPPPQWTEPDWKEVSPGISCKVLATDAEHDRVCMLVRLAPCTDYPPHRHAGVEELHMLRGELIVDGATFSPGQYRRKESGTVDRRVWTETGCTCILMTSRRDAIL
jgi:hypothetical protein